MRKFRSYQMKKVYNIEKIFVKGNDLKVGYLNINALLNAHHAEYINGDHNLRGLNFLALGETHLTSKISSEQIENVLPNWTIKSRFDSPDEKPHMGLLILAPKNSKVKFKFEA